MTPQKRPTLQAKESAAPGGSLVPRAFDYASLDTALAQQVQTAAQRIRRLVRRTLEDAITVGQELLTVKETLPHGQFSIWLHAEFAWTQRTAARFMAVAHRFGSKMDTVSIMRIDPSAAYLLASPSAPEAASTTALQRAENGERITRTIARKILGDIEGKSAGRVRASSADWPTDKRWGQLLDVLESFRRESDPRQRVAVAQQLRDFADSLQET